MKKFLAMFSIAIMAMFSLTSCIGCTTVNADEETVLIDKPWFFGHGGVQKKAVETTVLSGFGGLLTQRRLRLSQLSIKWI